jgi:hypothetical protein
MQYCKNIFFAVFVFSLFRQFSKNPIFGKFKKNRSIIGIKCIAESLGSLDLAFGDSKISVQFGVSAGTAVPCVFRDHLLLSEMSLVWVSSSTMILFPIAFVDSTICPSSHIVHFHKRAVI